MFKGQTQTRKLQPLTVSKALSTPALDPVSVMATPFSGEMSGHVQGLGRLIRMRELGEGAEGIVDLYIQQSSGRLAVVKKHRNEHKPTRGRPKTITTDIAIVFAALERKSWFTCKPYSWYFEQGCSVARQVSEYCHGGDLWNVFERYYNRRVSVPESLVWHIFLHVGAALIFLHAGHRYDPEIAGFIEEEIDDWNPCIHRDVRAPNCLIRVNDVQDGTCFYPDIVLNDFGYAIHLDKINTDMFKGAHVDPCVKTVEFQRDKFHTPPEFREDPEGSEKKFYPKFDWFQLGLLLRWCVHRQNNDHLKDNSSPYAMELQMLVRKLSHPHPELRFGDEDAFVELPKAQAMRDECLQKENWVYPAWAFGNLRLPRKLKRDDQEHLPDSANAAASVAPVNNEPERSVSQVMHVDASVDSEGRSVSKEEATESEVEARNSEDEYMLSCDESTVVGDYSSDVEDSEYLSDEDYEMEDEDEDDSEYFNDDEMDEDADW